MLKYLKRKHVSGEDSDDESQIPQPSTSEAKVSDVKKNVLYNDSYLAFNKSIRAQTGTPAFLQRE